MLCHSVFATDSPAGAFFRKGTTTFMRSYNGVYAKS